MRKLLSSAAAALAVTVCLAAAPTTAQAQYRAPVPALRVEVVPRAPGPNYIWRPGYWNWAGNRYAWVGGTYVTRGPGYGRWVEGHWGRRGWMPAHWVR